MYKEESREADFKYFISNYEELYRNYGHCFLAIRDKKVLGYGNNVKELIDSLRGSYSVGDYIIQECNGDESAYTASIMRLMIHA